MRNSKIVKVFICLLAASALFVFLAFQLWPKIESLLIQKIISAGISRKIDVNFEKPDLFFLGFSAESVNLRTLAGKLPLFLEVDQVDTRVEFLPLLSGKLNQKSTFVFYGGKSQLISSVRSSGRNIRASVESKEINLSQIPLVQFFSPESGYVDFVSDKVELTSGKLRSMDFNLKVRDFSKSSKTILVPRMTGLPFEIELPAFKKINLQTEGKVDSEQIDIVKFELLSDFGNSSLRGQLSRSGKILSLAGKVELTPLGQELLGPYLSLLSSGAVDENTISFTLRFKNYQSGLPVFDFMPERSNNIEFIENQ